MILTPPVLLFWAVFFALMFFFQLHLNNTGWALFNVVACGASAGTALARIEARR